MGCVGRGATPPRRSQDGAAGSGLARKRRSHDFARAKLGGGARLTLRLVVHPIHHQGSDLSQGDKYLRIRPVRLKGNAGPELSFEVAAVKPKTEFIERLNRYQGRMIGTNKKEQGFVVRES